jgi:hypothetical protein
VKLLRSGGGYLEGQAQHYSTRHLWIVVIGVLAAVIVGVIWHPALSIVPLLIAARQAKPAYKKLTHFRSGITGEQDVTRLLAKLPDEYVVVNDVMLPGQRGNVDHVVLGPCGIVVIETKRYRGSIACRRGRWFQNGRPLRNVGKQAKHGAVAIREFLCTEYPELRSTALRWVDSIVVFTHPLCRLEIDRPGITMIRFSELLEVMLAKGHRNRLPASIVNKLAHTLVREGRVRDMSA